MNMDKPVLHLSCDPAALRAALGLVGYAIAARSPMPILHHVLLQAQIGRATLTATSLDLTVRTNLAANVTVSGVATLPAKLLANIVKAAPEEAVLEIVVTAGRARLTCGNVEFELYTLPPGDFPTPVAPNGEPAVFMPAGALAEMLRQTAFAAGTDEMRPALTGVSVSVTEAQVRLVATDGAPLAMRTASRPQNGGASLETIIPARNALVLSRLCTVPDDEVALRLGEAFLACETVDTLFVTRTLPGPFPAWEHLVEAAGRTTTTVSISRERFLEGLERMGITADSTVHAVHLTTEQGALIARSATADVGRGEERIPAQVEGHHLTIGFNCRMLLDGLRAMSAETVLFRASSPLTPALLEPVGQQGCLYLVAPVRTTATVEHSSHAPLPPDAPAPSSPPRALGGQGS